MATTSITLFPVLLVAVVTYVIGSPCYEDWIYNDQRCYGFGSSKISWIEATALCSLFESYLADITSEVESEFINVQLRLRKVQRAWVGGTDMFNDSNWLWIGNKEPLTEYSNWYPGDDADDYDEEDNCIVLESNHNFQWSQDRCNHEYNFVCETKAEGTIIG